MKRRNISRIALALLLLCSLLVVFDFLLDEAKAQSVSVVINDGDAFAASTSVTLTMNVNPESAVLKVRYSNYETWNDEMGEPFSKTKKWTLLPGDGLKTVYYQIWWDGTLDWDWSQSYSDSISLDTISPNGSIVINDGAAYTNSFSVTLKLTANDFGSGVDQVRFSNSGTWGSENEGWESFSSPKPWSLSPGDGGKTVYCQVRDKVGHLSVLFSDTIVVDTAPPTGSIKINEDAESTTSNTVNLQLTANDVGSGVYKVRYSNDGNWDTEPWEDFSPTKEWTLTSDLGSKTVYYQIIDNAQQVSTFSDSVILATPPPSPTPTPAPTQTSTPTSSSPPTLTPTLPPSSSPNPSNASTPTHPSEPWDGGRSIIPSEIFYLTALIGLASIAVIIFVTFRNPKTIQGAETPASYPPP